MLAIIQSRMSSKRLPGKSLRPFGKSTLLGEVVRRASLAEGVKKVVVATSNDESDDEIARYCGGLGVDCFRGPLDNVLQRLTLCASHYQADAFARVNGDSPILDPYLLDLGIRLFRGGSKDLVTNVFPRSFPKGQSVEVVSLEAFNSIPVAEVGAEDLEHVTRFFYRNPGDFEILNFEASEDFKSLQLSVDSESDLNQLQRVSELVGDNATWVEAARALSESIHV